MSNRKKSDKKKELRVKVVLNIPKDINDKFVEYSKKLGITKSSFIIMATNSFISQQEAVDVLPRLIKKIELNDQKNNDN